MKKLLMVLGFPLWFPLLLVIGALVLSFILVLLCIALVLWVVFASLIGCGIGGTLYGFALLIAENSPVGMAMLGAALVCFGVSILVHFLCKMLTNICIFTPKWVFRRRKN